MNVNPFAAGSGGGIDFGTALNMPKLISDSAKTDSTANVSDFQALLNVFADPERKQRILDMTRDFQNKQMAEAGKYKALFGLPKQIMNAFTIPAAIAATGDIAAANTLATAGANMGSLYTKIQPMQVGIPTVNYGFSS
jgi:hypothetical protein